MQEELLQTGVDPIVDRARSMILIGIQLEEVANSLNNKTIDLEKVFRSIQSEADIINIINNRELYIASMLEELPTIK